MARVPTYDNFQAAPTLQPQARFDAPAMLDTAPRQAQETGKALMSAGGQMGQIALDMQREANKVRVDDGLNQGIRARTEFQVEALQLQGRNALERPDGKSLPDEYDEKLQKRLEEIEGGLGNDAQKQAFRQQAEQIKRQLYGALSTHMLQEQKTVRRETWAATIDTATNQANLLWGDEGMRRQSYDAIRNTIDEMAKDQGWDDKVKQAKLGEALSPMHAGVLQGMVDADRLDLARAYYNEHTPTMSAAVRARAMNMIEAGDFEKKTQEGAEAVWAMADGNAVEALKLAREKFSGKEEDAVVTRIKTLDAEKTTLRERAQRDAGDTAWGLYADGKKIPASLWAAMDGRDKIAIRNAQRAEANAAASASKEGFREARDAAYFTLYENDDALINARPQEITSLLKQGFTQTQVASLLRKKERFAKEAEDVSVNRHALNNAFLRNGIENQSKDDKALRGMIASKVDEEVYAEQQARGRALSREEKEKIINRQFLEVDSFYKQSGIFSTSTGTRKRKYYEVDMKESIVVPSSERDRISGMLRGAGVQVTPERIREFYMRELGR